MIVVIIVVPIIVCWKTLQTVWDDDELATSGDDYSYRSGEQLQQIKNLITEEDNKVTASNLGDGVEYDVTGINIISKVYENAEVAISLANVYKDHDESSEVLGKLEKGSLITIQKYDNGWSTVTNYTLSGWMKTENIKLPETNNTMSLATSGDTRTGTVKVSDSLRMRESASTSAKILKNLTNGTAVTILDSSNGWYKIKVGDTTGWVKSDYIKEN